MSDRFFDAFLQEHHCVAARSVDTDMKSGRKLSVHRYYNLEELGDIFAAYHFDAILFFSYDLDGGMDVYKELERLETTLMLAQKHDVKMFFYITSNELENRDETVVLEGRVLRRTLCRFPKELRDQDAHRPSALYLYQGTLRLPRVLPDAACAQGKRSHPARGSRARD